MSGIARRLTKLEAASGHTAQTLVIFIQLMPAERDSPATATVDDRVWHREPDESEEAFLGNVAAEARSAWPGNRVLFGILDHRVAPRAENRSEAAEASTQASTRRPGLPSFINVELMG